MKALRIKIVKDFLNRKVGEILPVRGDVGNDLVNLGLGEWVYVEVKDEHEQPETAKPVEIIKEPEVVKVVEEIKITEKVETTEPVKEKKKRNRKPKASENKEFNPKLQNK